MLALKREREEADDVMSRVALDSELTKKMMTSLTPNYKNKPFKGLNNII